MISLLKTIRRADAVVAIRLLSCVLATAPAKVFADLSPTAPVDGAPDGAVSLQPVDPVVEEPLRPLFSTPPQELPSRYTGCGRMELAVLPVLLILLCGLGACQRPRFHRRIGPR